MTQSRRTRYRARYVLQGLDVLERGYLDVEDGTIVDVGPIETADEAPDDVVDIGEVALVPGMVNAHSHAFQRAIRARTEYLPVDRGEDDFWSWRERMYEAVLSLGPEALEAVSRMACLEMVEAGYTTLGEFHYIHHDRNGDPYANPNELAHRVVRASRDVGLRVQLLRTAYHRSGFETPEEPHQRRFIESDVETYLERTCDLRDDVADREDVTVGMAPHSVRAVPEHWLREIGSAAEALDCPVHIHASEQRGELEQSRREYGTTPIEVFDDLGLLDERLTIVHATHTTDRELELMAEARPTVCACPTTERNLGDGILPACELIEYDIPIALGSDSHADIDPWTEMRLVEYHERLDRERRNVLAAGRPDGPSRSEGERHTADVLWSMGTAHGARALQLPVGRLEAGRAADIVGLDLDELALAGVPPSHLTDGLVFAASTSAVRDVIVGGERVVQDGKHPKREETMREFREHLPFD